MSGDGTETTFRRAPTVRIYDVADRMVLLGRDGNGHELSGDAANLARAVLSFLQQPHSRGELLGHIEALTGGPVEHPQVIDELVALLSSVEALEIVQPETTPAARSSSLLRHGPCRVVLGLTGAIASMYAPALIQTLQRRAFQVRVAATEHALRFVGAEALEALTHYPVITSLWPTGPGLPVPHINLAQWADAVVIAPASATTISRLATADHDSVVAATALATGAPVLVVPSMNPDMYASPGVQRNLAQIIADGMHVAHPACGVEMAETPEARVPLPGAAPPPRVIVQLLQAIMRTRPTPAGPASTPRGAEDWDMLYRQGDADALPWQTPDLDEDIAEALTRAAPPPASVLDVGTGLGTLAAACARRGHRVVATDISAVALEQARALAPDAPVAWLEDDITASKLHGVFDIVLDRGCLHLLLSEDERSRYAASVARRTAPGGMLIVKTLAGPDAELRGTTAYTARELERLLGDAFTLESDSESTLPGPFDAPDARLFVFRRTDD